MPELWRDGWLGRERDFLPLVPSNDRGPRSVRNRASVTTSNPTQLTHLCPAGAVRPGTGGCVGRAAASAGAADVGVQLADRVADPGGWVRAGRRGVADHAAAPDPGGRAGRRDRGDPVVVGDGETGVFGAGAGRCAGGGRRGAQRLPRYSERYDRDNGAGGAAAVREPGVAEHVGVRGERGVDRVDRGDRDTGVRWGVPRASAAGAGG